MKDMADRMVDLTHMMSFQEWESARLTSPEEDSIVRFTRRLGKDGDYIVQASYCQPSFSVSTTLCNVCQSLLHARPFTKTALHESFFAFQRSSLSCHLCLIFVKALNLELNTSQTSSEYFKKHIHARLWGMLKVTPTNLWEDTDVEALCLTSLEVSIEEGAETPPVRIQEEVIKTIKYPAADLFIDALPDDVADILDSCEYHEDLDTSSHTRMTLARYWLKVCRQSHDVCRTYQGQTTLLPSRVLDVGPSDGSQAPFLHESRGQVGTYICLSHRWGGSKILTTTMGTIDLRKNRIELVDMPKTFQDAVKVTRALGIRYLWADSLCIVQDNLGDWETEAQLMGEIYQNSILTIAAVEATSGDSGCFERWDGRNNRSCKIGKASFDLSSEGLSNSPRDYRIYVSHAQPKMTGYEDTFRPRGPLDTRGWVLQEEVLSTRVLSFCADGVYWECLHMDGSEHLPTGYIPGRGTERWTPARRYSKAFKRSLLNQSSDEFTRLGDVPLQSAWNALIENYSGRFLTHETDRLIAVQGLARSVQKFTAHGWICGLLEENFHAQLLWHIIDRIEGADWRSFGSDDTNMNISQPKNLIFAPRRHHPRRHVLAPSWSWATVSQRVTWDEGQDAEPIAEILSVKTHKLGVGGVEGRITIRGVILAAQARRGNRFEHDQIVDPRHPLTTSNWYYSDEGVWRDNRVMCLALSKNNSSTYCLVLYPTEKCSLSNPMKSKLLEFRRIGITIWTNENWEKLGGQSEGKHGSRAPPKRASPVVLDIV